MANFYIGKTVFWKKEERKIVDIEKGKKTNKIDYQNGVLANGFKSLPKRYVLDSGQKVTGQDLINHDNRNKL